MFTIYRIMFAHQARTLFSTHSTITLGNFLLSQRKNAGTPMVYSINTIWLNLIDFLFSFINIIEKKVEMNSYMLNTQHTRMRHSEVSKINKRVSHSNAMASSIFRLYIMSIIICVCVCVCVSACIGYESLSEILTSHICTLYIILNALKIKILLFQITGTDFSDFFRIVFYESSHIFAEQRNT